jgi:tRNA(Ile)-lysidine synthase
MNLLKEFQEHIVKELPFLPNKRLLLAVSGGQDSMVLLTLLRLCKFPFEVAHVNYQLRGSESDGDALFVKEHCKMHSIVYHETSFDTQLFAKAAGLGIQEAARKLRYQWFHQLIELHQFDFLLTAHHANDQAETVLFHLMRGAGAKGLAGMLSVKNQIVRPLLFASKQELIDFAALNNIPFRQDSSNEKDTYSRNFIRHQIMPKVTQIQPHFVATIQHHSRLMQHTWHYYQMQMELLRKEVLVQTEKNTFEISIAKLTALPFADMVLFHFVQEFGFNHSQCLQIMEAAKMASTGALFLSSKYRLLINREHFIVSELPHEIEAQNITLLPTQISIGQQAFTFEQAPFSRFEPNTWWLDMNTLQFPLSLRKIELGDKFSPLGMKQQQKVSDYLINKKIDRFLKEQSWVLMSNDKICFLGPHQISEDNKITSETKSYLKISLLHTSHL